MNRFKRFGVMLDCSRNAVANLEGLKRFISAIAKMGYNTLMLYTEDTYEVENQPAFGYLRGRYTPGEIKEIDSYCRTLGVELIPCIQTLAHFNAITRWPEYREFTDCNDILLAGDERTYKLIEDIFSTLAKNFTSRHVNIGMDEAHMIGLGKYLDLFGYQNRFEILSRHLERVVKIAAKYGFTPLMWSDMFFRLANHDRYATDDPKVISLITEEITSLVPEDVALIYWDYYSTDQKRYDCMLQAHKKFKNPVWFAGGMWTWTGFVPHNKFSIEATIAAMRSCIEQNVENVFFTLWGDNGAETSYFSVLPALFYTAEISKGIEDEKAIKRDFEALFGIAFDDFMLLDLPGTVSKAVCGYANPDKYMFYNDYFCGIFDSTVNSCDGAAYAQMAKKLGRLACHEEFGYIFDFEAALCEVLALKNDIGLRTREAYAAKDGAALLALADEYDEIARRIRVFHKKFQKLWFTENKPHGFDVQDIRIGGLILRTQSCAERLREFANGRVDRIPELEEALLPIYGHGAAIAFNDWVYNVSVNVV